MLVGKKISMVSFLGDGTFRCVEFCVDYSVVRPLTDPTGSIDGVDWRFGDTGVADLLLGYLGLTVADAEVVEDDHLSLVFETGDRIDVSLKPDDRVGPEAAHFVPAGTDGRLDVAKMCVW